MVEVNKLEAVDSQDIFSKLLDKSKLPQFEKEVFPHITPWLHYWFVRSLDSCINHSRRYLQLSLIVLRQCQVTTP